MLEFDGLFEHPDVEARVQTCDPAGVGDVLMERRGDLGRDPRSGQVGFARHLAGDDSQLGPWPKEIGAPQLANSKGPSRSKVSGRACWPSVSTMPLA